MIRVRSINATFSVIYWIKKKKMGSCPCDTAHKLMVWNLCVIEKKWSMFVQSLIITDLGDTECINSDSALDRKLPDQILSWKTWWDESNTHSSFNPPSSLSREDLRYETYYRLRAKASQKLPVTVGEMVHFKLLFFQLREKSHPLKWRIVLSRWRCLDSWWRLLFLLWHELLNRCVWHIRLSLCDGFMWYRFQRI